MTKPTPSMLSRREWLKAAMGVCFNVANASLAHSAAVAGQSELIYHQILDAAPWSTRYGMGCVIFQDRLWVLGGTITLHDGTHLNDVWSSADGVHWRQDLASAPWSPRWGHAVFALGDKIWLIGGLASVEPISNLNDIWSSADGKNWTKEVTEAPWPARHVWATTIHRNRMYLLGGASDGTHYYHDVISSEDGRHWQLETIKGPWFEKRKTHAAAAYRGKIFLGGGTVIEPSARALNDVWSSEDGRTWICVAPNAPWSARCCHNFIDYRGKLWLTGGNFGGSNYATDLWSTVDGANWRQETSQFAWPGRHAHGIVVWKNRVWILGGTSDSWGKSSRNDVWTFEAGETVHP